MLDCFSREVSWSLRAVFPGEVASNFVLGDGMECSTVPSSGIIKSKDTKTLVFKIQLQLCESRYFRPGILWGYPLKASPKNHISFCRVFGNRFRGILSNALGKAPHFFFLTSTSEPEPVENDDDRFVH
jgi:hypothetical protein